MGGRGRKKQGEVELGRRGGGGNTLPLAPTTSGPSLGSYRSSSIVAVGGRGSVAAGSKAAGADGAIGADGAARAGRLAMEGRGGGAASAAGGDNGGRPPKDGSAGGWFGGGNGGRLAMEGSAGRADKGTAGPGKPGVVMTRLLLGVSTAS